MSHEEKEALRELAESVTITLEGERARIVGWANRFPTVVSLDGRYQGEWSWAGVKRILENGGRFRL